MAEITPILFPTKEFGSILYLLARLDHPSLEMIKVTKAQLPMKRIGNENKNIRKLFMNISEITVQEMTHNPCIIAIKNSQLRQYAQNGMIAASISFLMIKNDILYESAPNQVRDKLATEVTLKYFLVMASDVGENTQHRLTGIVSF